MGQPWLEQPNETTPNEFTTSIMQGQVRDAGAENGGGLMPHAADPQLLAAVTPKRGGSVVQQRCV